MTGMSIQTEPEVTEPEVIEPEVIWHGTDIPDYNGKCLMSFSRMENFIWLATTNSAQCGKQLVLRRRDMNCRTKVHHVWKCPCCSIEFSIDNCDMARSRSGLFKVPT